MRNFEGSADRSGLAQWPYESRFDKDLCRTSTVRKCEMCSESSTRSRANMTLDKGEREHHPPVGGIPASQLPESDVLPRPVMESAARLLPANLAWFTGDELVLAEKAAAASSA